MRKIFSCWEKWLNSRCYHWLRADETYLTQFQNQPQLFRQKALTGAERWAVVRSVSLILLFFAADWLVQIMVDTDSGFCFGLQALCLSGAFVMAIGAVGVVVSGKLGVNVFCWLVLVAILFLLVLLLEQMYTVSLGGHFVVGYVLFGACLGMAFGGCIVFSMVNDTKNYLKRIGILA